MWALARRGRKWTLPKRKKADMSGDEVPTVDIRFDKRLTRYLRWEMRKRGFGEPWGGYRLADVACQLKVREKVVLAAVETVTHPWKGKRYWSETSDNGETRVGVRWMSRKAWRSDLGASETSLWQPCGGQYFWCPSRWARKQDEEFLEYIQKWFVWEEDCPSAEANGAWFATELAVNARQVDRTKCVTFHAGPRQHCPSSICRVDVRGRVDGVPGGVDVRSVTGVDKRCVMHLMKQKEVAKVVQDVVRMVEGNAREKEFAVVCEYGKHRSAAVVVLVLAIVYYNAVVAFHNESAFKEAQKLLNWNDDGKREQW